MMRRGKRQLTLGDAIKAVSQFSRDDRETTLVIADLINRGLVRLRDPYNPPKVVRTNHRPVCRRRFSLRVSSSRRA